MLAQAARRNASLQPPCTFVQKSLVRKDPIEKMEAPGAQEGTRVKTAHPAHVTRRIEENSVKVPRKKTTTRKMRRGNSLLTRKNQSPRPRVSRSNKKMLTRPTKEALKVFRTNRAAKTIAIIGKNGRRKEKMTFLLPVRKNKLPPQVSFFELGT